MLTVGKLIGINRDERLRSKITALCFGSEVSLGRNRGARRGNLGRKILAVSKSQFRLKHTQIGKEKSATDSGFRKCSTIRKECEMKHSLGILLLCVLLSGFGCQPKGSHLVFEVESPESESAISSVLELKLANVDLSCGQCQFGMPGDGCDLAIRMENKLYYVDGSSIDDHGDAHAEDGLCNCVRKAIVSGKVVNGRFIASDLKLVDLTNPSTLINEN